MGRLRSDLTVSERIKCRVLRLALTLCCWGTLTSIGPCPAASLNPQAPAPEARVAAPQPVIEWHGDRLSVQLRNAPWAVVLQELERHTGIRIRVKGSLPETLTQEFEALPLEQGLRQLFRKVTSIFFYAPGPPAGTAAAQLTEVWLVPRDEGGAPRPPSSPARSATAEPQGAPVPLVETAERGPNQEEATPMGEEEEATERQ
jgi:hypothetical protein